jgi:hypothetical protein
VAAAAAAALGVVLLVPAAARKLVVGLLAKGEGFCSRAVKGFRRGVPAA